MLRMGAEMGGGLLLLAAMVFHARYVILDAEGLLPERKAKAANRTSLEAMDEDDGEYEVGKPEQPVASSANDAWLKIDAPHASPHPALRREIAASPSASVADQPDFIPVRRKLTKDERRQLKARIQRERAERGA